MRFLLPAILIAAAGPALAQTADRYGGVGRYPAPAQPAAAAPVRVLTWPGKTMPGAAAAPARFAPAWPVQASPAPPPPQPAPPAPAATLPPPGPPQPPTSIYAPPPPQAHTSTVGQLPPARAEPAGAVSRAPQAMATNAGGPQDGARHYSVHRQFGLQPDPTPAPAPVGEPVQLVSSIDPVAGPDPGADGTRTRRIVTASGRTQTVQVRNASEGQ